MSALNPKNGQGDGAGFNRLRAAQAMRLAFTALLHAKHPLGAMYIDQIREYAGSQIVFYRRTVEEDEIACVAVFESNRAAGTHTLTSDIVVAKS